MIDDPLTDAELAEIKARLDEGMWFVSEPLRVEPAVEGWETRPLRGDRVMQAGDGEEVRYFACIPGSGLTRRAEFIANAASDIRRLLAEVRRHRSGWQPLPEPPEE